MAGICMSYPFIDVFAGAGGLGEGFQSFRTESRPAFEAVVSVEKEPVFCRTLVLRHFFHLFDGREVPEDYYRYVAGEITRDELFALHPGEAEMARRSVLCHVMENGTQDALNDELRERLGHSVRWALVGGPPCQAYSLAGRSRRKDDPSFSADPRHTLYLQYLCILDSLAPPVFVMENVPGLLSARLGGQSTLHLIMNDLRSAGYRLYSLSGSRELDESSDLRQLVVNAGDYGVPQSRKRLFILGIRKDVPVVPGRLVPRRHVSVGQAIGDLPCVRSHVSRAADSFSDWLGAIEEIRSISMDHAADDVRDAVLAALDRTSLFREQKPHAPSAFAAGMRDSRLHGIPQHETRRHMKSDLQRYFYAAVYARLRGVSPLLKDFPPELLPRHRNIAGHPDVAVFSDRFRVQLREELSSTVTAHIRKDGHYFIHYDPFQCRSLTVREAARLQSFPDNYFFEGNRTEQYLQIGNAVPPLLAGQIAAIVAGVLEGM